MDWRVKARRQLLGPEEVKVLTSSDGGNFQESVGWRKLSRPEPSFEDTILFPEPVAAKAVKVLAWCKALEIFRLVQCSGDRKAVCLHAGQRCPSSAGAVCGRIKQAVWRQSRALMRL